MLPRRAWIASEFETWGAPASDQQVHLVKLGSWGLGSLQNKGAWDVGEEITGQTRAWIWSISMVSELNRQADM